MAVARRPGWPCRFWGRIILVDLELSALQTEGKGEILSNPRVVTADLKKAVILQGRQIPYSEVDDNGKVTTLFKDALLKLGGLRRRDHTR